MLCMYLTSDTMEPKLNHQMVHSSGSAKHSKCCLMALILDIFLFLQGAYQSTTSGKFQDAISKLRNILLNVTLLIVDSKSEISEVRFCPALLEAHHWMNYWWIVEGQKFHVKGVKKMVSVFGFVVPSAFPHWTNSWSVRSFNSRYIIAMLLQCYVTLQVSCHTRPSSCWRFAGNTSWVSPWNWNARRCQRYVCSLPHIAMLALKHVVLSSVSVDHTWAAKTNLRGMYKILRIFYLAKAWMRGAPLHFARAFLLLIQCNIMNRRISGKCNHYLLPAFILSY